MATCRIAPLIRRKCNGKQNISSIKATLTRTCKRNLNSAASKNNYREGLFSLANLNEPKDFLSLANDAIEDCNAVRRDVHNSLTVPDFPPSKTLHFLDQISNNVCSVIDASELCRSVHTCAKWREQAALAFQVLSEYIGELNADVALYQSLIPITSNPEVMKSLTEEERRMAILLQKEFERDAIHLADDQRHEVQKLQGFVTQLESMFTENLLDHKIFDIKGPLAHEVFNTIPAHTLGNAIPQRGSSTSNPPTVTLSTEPHIANALLKYSHSPNLRKEVYFETNTSCPQNLEVLDALIRQRHELASKMGYPSYAHYFLSDKMASKPENVFNFLESVRIESKQRYNQDLEILSKAKMQVEGTNEPLQAWDLSYYSGLVKANIFQGQEEGGDGSIAGYFTVDQSLEGMQYLTQKLFGIVMKESDLKENERWDVVDNDRASAIKKFEFIKEDDGQELGIVYFDLHPREGKYNHAAHFTVRCGCEIRGSESHPNETEYQLPIVALVCNLSPPQPHNGSVAILSHSEVETLFHEFGHGLHSLLSRTSFQHLSGTRTAMDFVETPSHLMEYYVWDKDFLNIIGRHYQTGSQIPTQNLESLIKSRNVFKSIEVQSQCAYATFDQTIFGPPEKWLGGSINFKSGISTTDLFASLHKSNGLLYADNTHWHSKFGHLVTYGAGYYSYLYASIFSADLWNTCFNSGEAAFSRSAGNRYWNEVLVHGGSKDPNEMLKAMLGRQPRVDSYFQTLS